MNWQFIIAHLPDYGWALILTMKMAALGILFSLAIGLVCSVLTYYRVRILRNIVAVYTELSRNTPLLIQLFFLYFGLPKIGIKLDAATCGVIGMAFLGGSYMAEAIRGGLEAVRQSQIESGVSIGLSRIQLVWYVILPQAFSVAMPAIGANCIFLLKETSILGCIAIADLTFLAKDLIGIYYQTFEALFVLVAAYLAVLLPISLLFSWLEKRVRYAEFGN